MAVERRLAGPVRLAALSGLVLSLYAAAPIASAFAQTGATASLDPAGMEASAPSAPQPISAAHREMLNRAWALLQNNDVAAARLIYKKLANANVAEAAFQLGQTYDPDFLKTIPIAGLQPNPALAQQWYQRAAALGHAAATSRLSKLAAGPPPQ